MFFIQPVQDIDINSAQSIEVAMQKIDPIKIECNNWPREFAYSPDIECRMAHNGQNLIVRFDVQELYTMAKVKEDNGKVWTDSCVEFFISLDSSGYYNFEINPIGAMLMAFRKERPTPEYATKEVMATVTRIGTMGTKCFNEIEGDNKWSMTLIIPARALFKHKLESWSALEATMNLYKCGDDLSHPHFLSWRPIMTPQPDFHRPEFFGQVTFL